VQLFGLSLVKQKYPVIPLMHCQYIVSKINKLVSALRQVYGFLWVFRFPPPIKLTTMILLIVFLSLNVKRPTTWQNFVFVTSTSCIYTICNINVHPYVYGLFLIYCAKWKLLRISNRILAYITY
jgi:hypothetical protein